MIKACWPTPARGGIKCQPSTPYTSHHNAVTTVDRSRGERYRGGEAQWPGLCCFTPECPAHTGQKQSHMLLYTHPQQDTAQERPSTVQLRTVGVETAQPRAPTRNPAPGPFTRQQRDAKLAVQSGMHFLSLDSEIHKIFHNFRVG